MKSCLVTVTTNRYTTCTSYSASCIPTVQYYLLCKRRQLNFKVILLLKTLRCLPRTAVHLAARGGHAHVLATLLEEVPEGVLQVVINEPDLNGITPLFLAREK